MMIQTLKPMFFLFCSALTISACNGLEACDSCRSAAGGDLSTGGASGLTASTSGSSYRWTLENTFQYRNFERVDKQRAFNLNSSPDGHIHDLIDEWNTYTRLSYSVTKDLDIGITAGWRSLRGRNAEEPFFLGRAYKSNGIRDLEIDFKWRFKRQQSKGFPVDLALFGSIKPPTSGDTDERESTPFRPKIDAENQPSTGSTDGTLGVAVSRKWGVWGASGAISYTIKGEGTQHFKAPDALRIAFSGSKLVTPKHWTWKMYAGLGLQGITEFKGTDHGEIDRNHGGEHIFIIPSVSFQPVNRLNLSIASQLPIYQEFQGTHQHEDFGVSFSASVRF